MSETEKIIDLIKDKEDELKYLRSVLLYVTEKEVLKKKQDVEDFVLATACNVFNVSKEGLLSKSREREFLQPRSFCYYILNYHLNYSLTSISKIFNRTHATVINSLDNVEHDMKTLKEYRSSFIKGMSIIDDYQAKNENGNEQQV